MQKKTINDVSEIYELGIDKIVKTIKKEKARKILLQFPEGLKPYSQVICDEISDKTKSQCFIWLDSCFGACDVPLEASNLGVDLIVQFGHSNWKFKGKNIRVFK